MRLTIRTNDVTLNDKLTRHVERRLASALARYEHRLGSVAVYLHDVNGPRGGVGKKCRIVIAAPPAGPIVVEGAGDDLYSLVHRTAERAGFAVRRHFNRRRTIRRGPGAAALAEV